MDGSYTQPAFSRSAARRNINIYRRHFLPFFGISAIPNVVFLAIQFAATVLFGGRTHVPEALGVIGSLAAAFFSLFTISV